MSKKKTSKSRLGIFRALRKREPLTVDMMKEIAGVSRGALSMACSMMEMERVLARRTINGVRWYARMTHCGVFAEFDAFRQEWQQWQNGRIALFKARKHLQQQRSQTPESEPAPTSAS